MTTKGKKRYEAVIRVDRGPEGPRETITRYVYDLIRVERRTGRMSDLNAGRHPREEDLTAPNYWGKDHRPPLWAAAVRWFLWEGQIHYNGRRETVRGWSFSEVSGPLYFGLDPSFGGGWRNQVIAAWGWLDTRGDPGFGPLVSEAGSWIVRKFGEAALTAHFRGVIDPAHFIRYSDQKEIST
jgi:hypothetical protein